MSNTFTGSRSSSIRLMDRTNTKRSNYTTTTTNSTTFLPELYSTPPMPTFQKPNLLTPARQKATENSTPTRVVKNNEPVSPQMARFKPMDLVSTAADDDLRDALPLPHAWNTKHDRAICVLDARNYKLPNIVTKIRRTFPELAIPGTQISCAMIDKRLRQLDQNVEIDYWSIGLRGMEQDQRSKTLNPPESSRVNSSTALIRGSTGPSKRSTSPTASTPRSPSLTNLTTTIMPDSGARNQNVVTHGFYTGYKSHVS